MSPATLTPREAQRRYLFLSGLRWFSSGLIFPVQMLLYAARGIDLPTIGLLVALYSATVIALELPTGGLADLLGRRRTALLAGAVSVTGLLTLAVAQLWWHFAIASVVAAIGRALGSGPLEAWYVDTVRAADPQASLRTGISRGWAVEAIGLGLAATLGGWLPGLVGGALPAGGVLSPFSIPVLAAAGVATASLVAHALLMTEPAAVRAGATGGPAQGAGAARRPRRLAIVVRGVPGQISDGVRLASRDPVVRVLVLRTAAIGVAIAALEVLTPLQFVELLGSADRAGLAYGILATAAWLGSAASSAAAPMLCRAGTRVGLSNPLSMATACTALNAGAVAMIGLAALGPGGFWLAAAGFVLSYVIGGVPGPLTTEVLHERVDAARRATLVSVSSLALQLGALTGVLVVPRLAQWAGFTWGWAAATLALLVAAALTRRAGARTRVPAEAARPAQERCLVVT
ncbi:MAG TPA: MFS transporter [Pilimelia sp.]|nr:MFS transporter [Pilimelia sp.]